jgi:hypothetical protein
VGTQWPGEPSTLARQKPDRPIESVELRISFRAGRTTAEAIKRTIPAAVLRNGTCVLKIEGEQPGDVADKAREILEKIRRVAGPSKGFK